MKWTKFKSFLSNLQQQSCTISETSAHKKKSSAIFWNRDQPVSYRTKWNVIQTFMFSNGFITTLVVISEINGLSCVNVDWIECYAEIAQSVQVIPVVFNSSKIFCAFQPIKNLNWKDTVFLFVFVCVCK